MSIGSVIVTPTPTRRAVDRGDQGLGRGEQAQRELTPAVPPARRVVPGVEGVRIGKVHPGAERPTRTGDHHGAHLVVGVQVVICSGRFRVRTATPSDLSIARRVYRSTRVSHASGLHV
jgi:hypothetical protein